MNFPTISFAATQLNVVKSSRSLVRREIPIDQSKVCPSNQNWTDINQAKEELAQFVKKFLKHLMKQDGQNSSLRVFCRVDVSIFIKSPNVVSYFVNEVERGITTSLWVGEGLHTAGIVGMGIVRPLKEWLAAEKIRLGAKRVHTAV